MCYDHLLPIFFEDDRAMVDSMSSVDPSSLLYFPGGLGLSIPTVGMISKYPTFSSTPSGPPEASSLSAQKASEVVSRVPWDHRLT